jgi:hypothetical protein
LYLVSQLNPTNDATPTTTAPHPHISGPPRAPLDASTLPAYPPDKEIASPQRKDLLVRGNLTIYGYLLIVLGIVGIAALLVLAVIFLASLTVATLIFFALLIGLGIIGVMAYRDWQQSSYATFRDWYDAQRQWTQGILLVVPLAIPVALIAWVLFG